MDRFHKLFWEVYSRNCEIDNIDVTKDDLESIKKFDREKLYKTFRNLIHSLLDFKSKAKSTEIKELIDKNRQFESIITKLEADGRSHIAKHYQLRLEIESQKNIIDELNNEILGGKSENKQLKMKILQLDRALEIYKGRADLGRKSTENKRDKMQIDLESLAQVDHLKSVKSGIRVLSDKNKAVGGNARNIMVSSRSLKNRMNHIRCKSELAKSLKIIIPT